MSVNRLNQNPDPLFYMKGVKAGDGAALKGILKIDTENSNPFNTRGSSSPVYGNEEPTLKHTEHDDWVAPEEDRVNHATWIYDYLFEVEGGSLDREQFVKELERNWLNLEEAFELDKVYVFKVFDEVVQCTLKSKANWEGDLESDSFEMLIAPGKDDSVLLTVDATTNSKDLDYRVDKQLLSPVKAGNLAPQEVLQNFSKSLLEALSDESSGDSVVDRLAKFVNENKADLFRACDNNTVYEVGFDNTAVEINLLGLENEPRKVFIQFKVGNKNYAVDSLECDDNYTFVHEL